MKEVEKFAFSVEEWMMHYKFGVVMEIFYLMVYSDKFGVASNKINGVWQRK